MAYNESANIARMLRSIQQQTIAARINRIIVVASGCTDDTCAEVERVAAHDPRIVLVEQPVRAGKTAALNTFLSTVHEAIVVVPSADLVLEPETIEHLVGPLEDRQVGMVGSHPVPTNAADTFIGFAVRLMWELHHRVATLHPKMGELVAFRNRIAALDTSLVADEVSVENQIRNAGLEVVYAPAARVYNRGPETLREFIAQRERWIVANMQIERAYARPVSTLSASKVLRAVRELVIETRPRLDWLVMSALLEAWCRLRAYVSFAVLKRGDRYVIWETLRSTKSVLPDES